MDYEVLYKDMQDSLKRTKDLQDSQKKLSGTITKDIENGDLKALAKDLGTYSDRLTTMIEINADLKSKVEAFDSTAYLKDGDFSDQLLTYCQQLGVDVIGEPPTLEMFPYKVRIAADEQAVYMNNKKMNCVRPKKVIENVKASQDKLSKSNFNAESFGKELQAAYDLLILKKNKKEDSDMPLKDIYAVMVPMNRMRKVYDLNAFAYDLSRFVEKDAEEPVIIDGRRIQPGPSREASKCIRLLDSKGKESFWHSIRFYKD